MHHNYVSFLLCFFDQFLHERVVAEKRHPDFRGIRDVVIGKFRKSQKCNFDAVHIHDPHRVHVVVISVRPHNGHAVIRPVIQRSSAYPAPRGELK